MNERNGAEQPGRAGEADRPDRDTLSMGALEWSVLVLVALMFGSAFFFLKVALDTIPPLTTAAGRTVLAAPLAWAFVRLAGGRLPPLGRDWLPLLGLGILAAAIPYTAVAWGQTRIASGLGGILFATIPIFTVIAAHFLTHDEKFTARRFLGAAVGLGGVTLVIGPEAFSGFGGHLAGEAVTLWAALSYGLAGIFTRRLMQYSPVVLTAGQIICASLVMTPIALIVDRPWTLSPDAAAYWSMAAMVVLNTVVPLVLTVWLIRRSGATNTSMLAFLMPVVAVGIGAWLLDEELAWGAYGGLVLILLGAAAINARLPFADRLRR